jgi:hypothetical protein
MEIDITDFFETHAAADFSGSVLELGPNAAGITWLNALIAAMTVDWLNTREKRDKARDWLRTFGEWSDEEIDGWDTDHLTAMLIQYAAGDIREGSGQVFRSGDRLYLYVGE